jgi:L-seryl-tRNA(Ser) seleniumtransferase
LRDGEPRIEVLTASNPSLVPAVHEGKPGSKSPGERKNRLEIISMTLQPGEDMIVGKRVREILSAARKAGSAPA